MMIFKLGLKELKKNLFINILCFLQLTVIFVVAIAMISSLVSQFEKYIPFKEELSRKGFFLQVDQMNFSLESDPKTKIVVDSEEVIKNNMGLKNVEKVLCMKDVWVTQEAVVRAYSSELVKKYTPEMESGEWLSEKNLFQDDVISGVISENSDNIDTGDVIEISEAFGNGSLKVYIVGKIANGTTIIGSSQAEEEEYTCDNLYQVYDFNIEEKPLLILNYEELKKTEIPFVTQVRGSLIVNYDDTITSKEIKENYETIMRNKNLFYGYSSLDEMNINSKKNIYSAVLKLLPMIISIFILTAISILSISAVNAKIRIKTYAVYYICGMQWKHIIIIEIIKSSIIALLGCIVAAIICTFAKDEVLFGGLIIRNGILQILGCLLFALLFVLLSVVFPIMITRKEKPATLFHSN